MVRGLRFDRAFAWLRLSHCRTATTWLVRSRTRCEIAIDRRVGNAQGTIRGKGRIHHGIYLRQITTADRVPAFDQCLDQIAFGGRVTVLPLFTAAAIMLSVMAMTFRAAQNVSSASART